MNDHFDRKFEYETYLELKISIGAFDCLNITSESLLGCSFVPKQGPRFKAQGSRIKAQGSRTKVKDPGPSPATNEHPGRATDVILRQSKAPIELFNSRSIL